MGVIHKSCCRAYGNQSGRADHPVGTNVLHVALCSIGGSSTPSEGSLMLLQRYRGLGMLGQASCPVRTPLLQDRPATMAKPYFRKVVSLSGAALRRLACHHMQSGETAAHGHHVW